MATMDLRDTWLGPTIGRAEQNVENYRTVVKFGRRLVTVLPRFRGFLAQALWHMARRLADDGEVEEALTAVDEAVLVARRGVAAGSARCGHELACSLAMRARVLEQLRRYEQALAAADESIGLCEGLLPEAPADVRSVLLLAMWLRGLCLHKLDRPEEALLAGEQVVRINRDQRESGQTVKHRQRHISANGRQSCVDESMADIITTLWTSGCDTRNCCQDIDGRALVVPAAGQASQAIEILAGIGIQAQAEDGSLYFPLPGR